jgi:hypothetical protein
MCPNTPRYDVAGLAMDALKLVAFDKEDLEVVSTHLQDAIVKVADVHWRPKENRLVVALGRFDWEAAAREQPQFRRRLSALRFDRVMKCQCRNVEPKQRDAILNLLAVEFTPTEAPGGIVTLLFSGGAALRFEVECLEAELADLGPCWATDKCPQHALEATAAGLDASASPRH